MVAGYQHERNHNRGHGDCRDISWHYLPVLGGCLGEGCDLMGSQWREELTLEQPVLEGLRPMGVTHSAAL